MSLYLAVHADATSTECVVAEERRVLSRVAGEATELEVRGPEEARERLRRVLVEAGERAGVPLYLVTRACVGMEGMARPEARNWAESVLGELLTGELVLVSDEEIALEAAFGRGPGVLVMAGAHSHVVGRCGSGARFTAGGWGPALSDEGSAYWIGREGLRSGLRALDRCVPSCLLKEAAAAWGTASVSALVARASERLRPDFAALAEMVARCATQGDLLARSVLERAGEELAAQTSLVLSRMRQASCAAEDMQRVAYSGEVLTRLPGVCSALHQALGRLHPAVKVDGAATEPLEGALARARREP